MISAENSGRERRSCLSFPYIVSRATQRLLVVTPFQAFSFIMEGLQICVPTSGPLFHDTLACIFRVKLQCCLQGKALLDLVKCYGLHPYTLHAYHLRVPQKPSLGSEPLGDRVHEPHTEFGYPQGMNSIPSQGINLERGGEKLYKNELEEQPPGTLVSLGSIPVTEPFASNARK